MTQETLLVGGGRLARHVGRYLELESIDFARWKRTDARPFRDARANARRIVLLISDDAIEPFLEEHRDGDGDLWIHCSGSLSTPLAEGAHPIMTFGLELYDLETYRGINFVTERGRAAFDELFPELANPHSTIRPQDKPLYHALCVLSGNGTVLLWQKAFAAMRELGLTREALVPYLDRVVRNLISDSEPLTGPLDRGDASTVRRNLEALRGDPFREVYQALILAHRETP
jgi:predicted short-subunit dehydrogenase-like oxidoreductase (DUF2520 family)